MPTMSPSSSNSAMTPHNNNFVIVGAGPVGLLATLAIRKHGDASRIDIYERRWNIEQSLEESYPIGVTPRGLRALQAIAPPVYESIVQSAAVVDSWDIHVGSRQVAQVKSGVTMGHTRYSVTQALYHQVVEEAEASAIHIHWGHSVVGLDTQKRTLTMELSSKETIAQNNTITLDCSKSILLACDGANSAVRQCMINDNNNNNEDPSYTPLVHETTPWNMFFRTLLIDQTTATVPLNPASHAIYNGTYCAITGPPEHRQWVVVPSAKPHDEHADWFFLDTDHPSPETMQQLRRFLAEKVPPLQPTEHYFSDHELRAFFQRRRFTGSLVRLEPLHYPHKLHHHHHHHHHHHPHDDEDKDEEDPSWIVFLGDSAHSVFPATGEGLNSGLDDVLVWSESVLKKNNNRMSLSNYTAARQSDVTALSNLAHEILSTSTATSTQQRVIHVLTLIGSSLARFLHILGPSEAELRYGPNSQQEPLSYDQVWKQHVRDTHWIRTIATVVVKVALGLTSWMIPVSWNSLPANNDTKNE